MLSIIERSCQSERQDKCLPHPQYGSVASDATLSRGLLQGSSDHTWANLLDVTFNYVLPASPHRTHLPPQPKADPVHRGWPRYSTGRAPKCSQPNLSEW